MVRAETERGDGMRTYTLEEWFGRTALDKYPIRCGQFHNKFYRWLDEVRVDNKGKIVQIKKRNPKEV